MFGIHIQRVEYFQCFDCSLYAKIICLGFAFTSGMTFYKHILLFPVRVNMPKNELMGVEELSLPQLIPPTQVFKYVYME